MKVRVFFGRGKKHFLLNSPFCRVLLQGEEEELAALTQAGKFYCPLLSPSEE